MVLSGAFHNLSTSPSERFTNATYFSNCCSLVASPRKSHAWFTYHFAILGNLLLDPPGSLQHVAFWELADKADTTTIDPLETFAGMAIQVPTLASLFSVTSIHDLTALDPSSLSESEETFSLASLSYLLSSSKILRAPTP